MAGILELDPELLPLGASPLHLAANQQDVEPLTALLETDCSLINELDRHGRTPLVVAIENGRLNAARVLIQYGANLDVQCGEGNQTIMQVLSAPVFHSFIESLILQEIALPFSSDTLAPLLPMAAYDGMVDLIVKLVTQCNVDVNCKDYLQQTALHYACQRGNIECVHLLLEFNADMLVPNSSGSTALHLVCASGDLETAKVVLQRVHSFESLLNAQDTLGCTPVHVALYSSQYEVLLYILTHFSQHLDLTLADHNGHTLPGLLFTFRCSMEVIPNPYKHTLPFLCKEEATWLLHTGVAQDDLLLCSFSIDQGADINCFDLMQQSPLLLAAKLGLLEICELLASHGADPNAADIAGKTPLVYAAELDHLKVVVFLLSLPAINLNPLYIIHNKPVSQQLLCSLLTYFERNLSAPKPNNWRKWLALAAPKATEEAFGNLVEAICPPDWIECLLSEQDSSQDLVQPPNLEEKVSVLPLYAEEEPDHEPSRKDLRSISFKKARKLMKPFECMKKEKLVPRKTFKRLKPAKAKPLDLATSHRTFHHKWCNLKHKKFTGYHPLHEAARHGNEAVLSYILSKANDQSSCYKLLVMTQLDDSGYTVLELIAKNIKVFAGVLIRFGLYSSFQEKLQEHFGLPYGISIEETLLHYACIPAATGDPKYLTTKWPGWYLKQQVTNLCERLGQAPISVFEEEGKRKIMKIILEHPSLDTIVGDIPHLLYAAVEYKCLWAVRLLLDHGVSPTAKYKERYALTEAARQCQVETIDLLLQDGFSPFLALPDLEHLCSSLCPTLVTLVNQGFVAPVQKLIAGLPITDILWSTPTGPRLLYVALFSPKAQDLGLCLAKSFVSFLCKYSANWGSLYSKTWSDICTSLKRLLNYTAVFKSVHLPQINHLIELITFCNERIGVSEMGLLFHTLCGLGKLNLVRLMLENAGDVKSVLVNKLDSQQRSPLFYAAFGGHLEIVHLLLDECCIVYSTSSQPPLLALLLYFALAQFSVEYLDESCGKLQRSTFYRRELILRQLKELPTHSFSPLFQNPDKSKEFVQLLMPPDTSILQELLTVSCIEGWKFSIHLLWLISSACSMQPLECLLTQVAANSSILSNEALESLRQVENPGCWDDVDTILDGAVVLAPFCLGQVSSASFDRILARCASTLALHKVKQAAQKGYWNLVLEAVTHFSRLASTYTLSELHLLKDYQWVLCHAAKVGRTEILSSICCSFSSASSLLFGENCRPLSVAVKHNHVEAVDILVKAGDALDNALEVAVKFGRTEVFKLLLEHARHNRMGLLVSQSAEKLTRTAARYNRTESIKLLFILFEDTEVVIGCDFSDPTLSFWFLVLLEGTKYGHELLGLQAVSHISDTQMKEVLQHERYKDILYWCCYWGMSDLLECIPFTSAQLLKRTHGGCSPWECAIANGHVGKLSYLPGFPDLPDNLDEWFADGPLSITSPGYTLLDKMCAIGLLFNGSFHQLCSKAVYTAPPSAFLTAAVPEFQSIIPNLEMLVKGIILGIPHLVETYLKHLGKYAGKVIKLMHHVFPLLHLTFAKKDNTQVLELLLRALFEANLLSDLIGLKGPCLKDLYVPDIYIEFNSCGYTPLSLAVKTGSVESARTLLRCGPESMIKFVHPETADTLMHLAVRSGSTEMVKLVIQSLGNVASEYCLTMNNYNECPLYLAYTLGNCGAVRPLLGEITKLDPLLSTAVRRMALRATGWFRLMMSTSPKPLTDTLPNSYVFNFREIKGRKDGFLIDVFRSAVHFWQNDIVNALLFTSDGFIANEFLPSEPGIIFNTAVFNFLFGGAPPLKILTESDFTSAVCSAIHERREKDVVNFLKLIQANNLCLRSEMSRVAVYTEPVTTLDVREVFSSACRQKQLGVIKYLMKSTYPPIKAALDRPTILKGIATAVACGCFNSAAYLQLESGLSFQESLLPKGVELSLLTSFIFVATRGGYYTVVDLLFMSMVATEPAERLPLSAAWITHNWTEYECQLVMKQLGGNSAPSNPWNMEVTDGDGCSTLPVNIDWESFNECLLHSPQLSTKYTPLLVEAILFSPAVLGQMVSRGGEMASVNVLELFESSSSSIPSSLIISCVLWPSEPSSSTTLGGHGLLTLSYMPHEGVFVFPESTYTPTDLFPDSLCTVDSGIHASLEYSALGDVPCYLDHFRNLASSYYKSTGSGYSSAMVQLDGFTSVKDHETFSVVYSAVQTVLSDCCEVLKLAQRPSVLYSHLQDKAWPRRLGTTASGVRYNKVSILVSLDFEEPPPISVSLKDKVLTISLNIEMENSDSDSNSQFPVLPSYELLLESICSCIVDAELNTAKDKVQSLINRAMVPKLKKSLKCTSLDADFVGVYLCDTLGNICKLSEVHQGHLILMKFLPKFRTFLHTFSEMLHVLSYKPRVHSSVRHLFENGFKITFSEMEQTGITVKAGVPNLILSTTGVQKGSYHHNLLDMLATLVKISSPHTQNLQSFTAGIPAPFACHLNMERCHGLFFPVVGSTGMFTVQLVDYSGVELSSPPTANCYLSVTIKTPSHKLDVGGSSEEPGRHTGSKQIVVMATKTGEFEVEWTPEEEGLHCLFLNVNGTPINGSPFKAVVAKREMVQVVLPVRPTSEVFSNLNKGSCGSRQTQAGSPLVFIASHRGSECNCHTLPPNVVLIQRKPIRPLPSSTIHGQKQQEPQEMTQASVHTSPSSKVTSNLLNPSSHHPTSLHSLESLSDQPLHRITVCAASGSSSKWVHVPTGEITLCLAMSPPNESQHGKTKPRRKLLQNVSACCFPLGNGLYRVQLICTLACTFKVFATCATCQAVMHMYWIDQKALLPTTCYVLPGPFCSSHSVLTSKRLSRMPSKTLSSKPDTYVDTVVAGSTVTLFLKVRDPYGNAHTSGGAVKRAVVKHAAQRHSQHPDMAIQRIQAAQQHNANDAECRFDHLGNGEYQLKCRVFTAGKHSVVITDQYRSHIMGTVRVQSGRPHPAHCRLHPMNTYQGEVSQPYGCYLYLFDQYFNGCLPESCSLVEANVGTQNLHCYSAFAVALNCVKLSFTPTSAGKKPLVIKVCGQPIPGSPLVLNIVAHPVSFQQKFQKLKTYLVKNHCVGYTPTLTMSRENVLESAIQELHDHYFHHIIRVRFGDEPGMDTGGVSREFFHLLCLEFINPQYALFQCVNGLYRPNPNSSINPSHLFYFNFFGKLLAKTVCDGHQTTVRFTPAVYKYLLHQECTLDDLKIEDPALHSGLIEILNSTSEEALVQLSVNFTATQAHFGALHTIELEHGGEQRMVTMDNREEFVHKLYNWHLTGCVQEQLDSLERGFSLLVPHDQLELFSPHEMEVVLSGQPTIELSFIKSRTTTRGYSQSSEIVQWLWEVLESFSQEERCQFLQFTTGCACLPSAAMGQWEFRIQKGSDDPSLLPVAATCFNALTLPQYPSRDVLRQKLEVAIAYGQQTFLLH